MCVYVYIYIYIYIYIYTCTHINADLYCQSAWSSSIWADDVRIQSACRKIGAGVSCLWHDLYKFACGHGICKCINLICMWMCIVLRVFVFVWIMCGCLCVVWCVCVCICHIRQCMCISVLRASLVYHHGCASLTCTSIAASYGPEQHHQRVRCCGRTLFQFYVWFRISGT